MTTPCSTPTVEQWGVFELALRSRSDGNPFMDVDFTAQFSDGQRSVDINGFYDGDGIFRVRFMPDAQGEWSYRTASNRAELDQVTGTFVCVAPAPNNHGPVRVARATHFDYADGTPYFPVGTTCYTWQLQNEERRQRTLATLQDSPFNKLRFSVFPVYYQFNRDELPFYPYHANNQPAEGSSSAATDRWDFMRFNPQYFRNLEQRVGELMQLGIEADLILFHAYDGGHWGFDRMPADANTRYLKYLVARLAAYRNVWWSFANEYDLLVDITTDIWDAYFKLVQETDPYNHPRSIHNMLEFYDHRKSWVTHCSVQYQHVPEVPTWLRVYGKPVVVDEFGYEGDLDHTWGNLSAEEVVLRFWTGFADGGYMGHGEALYDGEAPLWVFHGCELRGKSAPRIAFLRQIIEGVPAAGLTPITPIRFAAYKSVAEMRALTPTPADTDRVLGEGAAIITGNPYNVESASHSGTDYYLFYSGTHQPRTRTFHLPDGVFRIDVIDTWDMTINTVMDRASGTVTIEIPVKLYLAVRIQRV